VSTPARPNPAQWLWYAFGGRLPHRLREWVLHDLTCKTWLVRYGVRAAVRMVPVVAVVLVVLLLVHAPTWLAVAASGIGLIVAVYYSMSYAWERCESQLSPYGYPEGHATATRRQLAEYLDTDRAARYNARWRDNSA
jgi:hypothetical protein